MKRFVWSKMWYQGQYRFLAWLLLPLSALFWLAVTVRRCLYRVGILKTIQFPVPVIIVGNLTVGGTGKTPFVLWLVKELKARGYQPGIVSRGFGGKITFTTPHLVTSADKAEEVSDEAILLARNADCPVMLAKKRVLAVAALLKQFPCDIIIADDGLQHYGLARQVEVLLVDGERGFGNGFLLPAGPLREPKSRAQSVNFMVTSNTEQRYTMRYNLQGFTNLLPSQPNYSLSNFPYQKVHAIAGIGHPERFFTALQQMGLTLITHAFPDHHLYSQKDLEFSDDLPIIMTEKDAVKCEAFASEKMWYLKMNVVLSNELTHDFFAFIDKLKRQVC